MRFAVSVWSTDYGVQPGPLARAVEERGFEALFLPEHTHIPVRRETPYVGEGPLPTYYADTYDPFVALMCAADATSSLRVGTGVCLVPERDPILLAREAASLDRLSGGRLLLGVGAGWNLEELRNHGVAAGDRFKVLADSMRAVRSIWSADEAEYHGAFVEFDPIRQGVRPLQRPGPPILIGLDGASSLDSVLAYGDGWFPSLRGQTSWATRLGATVEDLLRRRIAGLRERAAEAGRASPSVTLNGVTDDRRALERYAAVGVDRVVFVLEPRDEGATFRELDRLAEAMLAVA